MTTSWVLVATTVAGREKQLDATIRSVTDAGWREGLDQVSCNGGVCRNYIHAIDGVKHYATDSLFLFCQDDVRFSRGLRAYLERTLHLERHEAACLYMPEVFYRQPNRGWYGIKPSKQLCGALCNIYTWPFMYKFQKWLLRYNFTDHAKHIDSLLGLFCKENGHAIRVHDPSLVQHAGMGISTLGSNPLLAEAPNFHNHAPFPECGCTYECPCAGFYGYVDGYTQYLTYLRAHKGPCNILEWGPGKNTQIAKDLGHTVHSVEHNSRYWYLAEGCDYLFAKPLESPEYVKPCLFDDYDVFFIDGRRRQSCLYNCFQSARSDALIFLHDANRKTYHETLGAFPYVKFINKGFAVASKTRSPLV